MSCGFILVAFCSTKSSEGVSSKICLIGADSGKGISLIGIVSSIGIGFSIDFGLSIEGGFGLDALFFIFFAEDESQLLDQIQPLLGPIED